MIGKPIRPDELRARARMLLRRAPAAIDSTLRLRLLGPVRIERDGLRQVIRQRLHQLAVAIDAQYAVAQFEQAEGQARPKAAKADNGKSLLGR